MVFIEAIRPFKDVAEQVERKPGDRWEVDEARFEAINSTPNGQLAVQVEQPKPKRARKRKPDEEER